MRILKGLVLGALITYFLLLSFLMVFQRSFIYFPSKQKPTFAQHGKSAEGYEVMAVTTEDGLTLEGWYYPAKDPEKPTFIWFHGNAADYANRVYWANNYTKLGYGVVLTSYRGYGGNPGKPTERNMYRDARAWVKAVQTQLKKAPEDIVFYGESLGTGVAIKMSTEFDSKAVVLHTPYKSLVAIAQKHYPIFPVKLVMLDQFNSIERVKDIKAPVLMFHGTQDEVLPYSHALELFEAAPEPKFFYTAGDAYHSTVYDFKVDQEVVTFLDALDAKSE